MKYKVVKYKKQLLFRNAKICIIGPARLHKKNETIKNIMYISIRNVEVIVLAEKNVVFLSPRYLKVFPVHKRTKTNGST